MGVPARLSSEPGRCFIDHLLLSANFVPAVLFACPCAVAFTITMTRYALIPALGNFARASVVFKVK